MCFKFQQNCIINEKFDSFEGEAPLKISISIIIGKHMKLLCSKFLQNCTINEEFDFWGG